MPTHAGKQQQQQQNRPGEVRRALPRVRRGAAGAARARLHHGIEIVITTTNHSRRVLTKS